MARNWTDAQKSAMDTRNKTLLVCAAAGSGKTAVLTERIIRTLLDTENPADISRILVVTFTKAAAEELRTRISSALSEAITTALAEGKDTTYLSRQLMLLGGASISTIDSFYLDLVKKNFQEAGMPPTFRMADENELYSLRRELMNDTIDCMYAEFPDFYRISDAFCDIRREESLCDTLLEIALRLERYPEDARILLRSASEIEAGANTPLDTAWGEIFMQEASALARCGISLFDAAISQIGQETYAEILQKKHLAVFGEYLLRCHELDAALQARAYAGMRDALTRPFSRRTGTVKANPPVSPQLSELLEICEEFRARWKKQASTLCVFESEEIAQSATDSASLLRLLYEAIKRFGDSYNAAKALREVAEFSDVSRAAYRLLVDQNGNPTPLAQSLSLDYDAIYIDEYQDVNAMQDATFRAIANERNRFMVGDIKQSIYRFRGAQPAIFTAYRNTFPELSVSGDAPNASIFMSECFRCDENIIRFSNAVSCYLFERNAKSIGYNPKDALHFSKALPHDGYESKKCNVVLIERDRESDPEATRENPEARWIAYEIHRLLTSNEKKADGTPIRAGDIAILMRKTSLCAPIAKQLSLLGIPCNDTSRRSFFENADVLCVYSLLCALDNPLRDVALAATLRSPFFGFSLEDLVHIRACADHSFSLFEALRDAKEALKQTPLGDRILQFEERFTLWRDKAKSLPVDRLLRYLYRESAILSFAGRESEGNADTSARRANLQRLYEYSRTFEAGSFKGLYQFVRYIDGIMESGGKMPAPDGSPDAVSLITVHHSKGLEYPVCFLVGTASSFSQKDTEPVLLDDEYLGCALRIPNAGPFSRADTFFRKAIALSAKRQSIEEEMRILYVALTRARERLYVTANPTYGTTSLLRKAELAATQFGGFMTDEGPSYIAWILTALSKNDHSAFAELSVVQEKDIPSQQEIKQVCNQEVKINFFTLLDTLKDHFSYVYPNAHLTRLPAKLSVSKLSPGALDVYDKEYDKESNTPEALRAADSERLLHTFDRTPLFGTADGEKLAARRGTATHEFLQFCDFARVERTSISKELEHLIAKGFLSPETRTLIRENELARFFQSDFYAQLKSARQLRRETRFHIFLPASQFTNDPQLRTQLGDERLAVQGVIDLFFYNDAGELILCDYKTDRLSDAERKNPALAAKMLSDRHGEQLSYYAKALQEICGKAPDRILIYSLPLGEAVEIARG